MASATVRISYYGGSTGEPSTGATAETGFKFNAEDTQSGTAAISIPTTSSGSTNFSWYKQLALDVTTTGDTSITNRQIARSSAPPAGIILYFKATTGYVQATAANNPADSTSADNAAAATYTALTTTMQAYSTASATTSSGRNGGFATCVIGVSSTGTYTGGAGSAIALPNVQVQYDEA